MTRSKRDPKLVATYYNPQNVERAIGFVTALINTEYQHHKALAKATEYYTLSTVESGMVYTLTVDLIAPQFRDSQSSEHVATTETVPYTLEEIKANKEQVRAKLIAAKQNRAAAKQ